MKKFVAVILSLITILSVFSGVTVMGADENIYVVSVDNNPISYKEVIDAKNYLSVFYLDSSMFSYDFEVIHPDGSRKLLKAEKDITENDRKNVQYLSYGEAYIDFNELEEAKSSDSRTVPVHINLTLSKKNAETGTFDVLYKKNVTVEKTLVTRYIASITPVKNIPDYAYEGSETAFLDETEFKIVYWNGTSETLGLVKTATDEKTHYTLDGKEFTYDVNHSTEKIYISYLDASCAIELEEVREFPFESIQIVECELNGDMPVKLNYKILRKGSSQPEKYVKTVNAYSGYIDFIDGYAVEYSTEGSKYTSTVAISVGGILKAEKTYELQQQSFFQKLIAKIVLFFKAIFASGIF